MSALSDLFKKIADANVGGGGNYIKHGSYLLEIKRAFIEKKRAGMMYITEFIVRESTPIDDSEKPNAVGSDCSFAANLEQKDGVGLGNVKGFILGLYGLSEKTMSDEEKAELPMVIETLTNDDPKAEMTKKDGSKGLIPVQPARGMLVRCSTYKKQTKDKSKTLTLPNWEAVSQTAEEIKARRAALDTAATAALPPKAA